MAVDDVLEHPIFSLRAIYLRKTEVSMADGFDPLLPGQGMRGQFRITEGSAKVEQFQAIGDSQEIFSSCVITTKYDFQYIGVLPLPVQSSESEQIKSSSVLASISAEITAHYAVPKDKLPSDEIVNHWRNSSVMAHCWPYWREYCQNTMVRMNLPVMIMPMLSPGANKKRNSVPRTGAPKKKPLQLSVTTKAAAVKKKNSPLKTKK